jgi:hypothetical protein
MRFSLIGLAVILLPLLPNLLFLFLPSMSIPSNLKDGSIIINIIEHGSRILFFIAMIFLKNKPSIQINLFYLLGMLLCLLLYYALWGRYFINGQNYHYLFDKLGKIPIPMAVFPVLYYLLAALWLSNVPGILTIILFAIAHFINSYNIYNQLS